MCHFPPLSGHTLMKSGFYSFSGHTLMSGFYSFSTCQHRSWSCNSLFVGRAAHCLMFFLQPFFAVVVLFFFSPVSLSYAPTLSFSMQEFLHLSGLYGVLVQKILLGSLSNCVGHLHWGFPIAEHTLRLLFFIPRACV